MYLHLGQDYIVPLQSVVAVFDMDTATTSKRTRLLLERLQDEGRIIELYDDLPPVPDAAFSAGDSAPR